MVHLPQTIFFFWKKIINIIFIYLLDRFILQNLKQILKPIQIYEDVPPSGPKYPNLFWTKLFGKNYYYYFHLPIGPFHWAKFKKNSYSGSRVMRMHHFWAQNGPFALNNYFWKIIKITLIYLLSPFIVQNFKKILPGDPELWGCAIFLGAKWPISLNETFFQKAC